MKINELTKRKLKLFISLLGNLVIAVIISIVVYFILALFFENTLSELVARLNYDLYAWIVENRDFVVYVYIGIVLAVIIYRFISKYVNSINEVYNSLDSILKEDNETIKLPNLKTPLTSIIGYLTLLSDEKDISKKSQEKYIKIALDKALRVEELTNQFFDITRYNLHDMPINKKQINISYLLEQLVDECYPMLEKNNLKCNLKVPEKVMYMGDGDKLARAFDNLLKNAINYSYENTTIEIELNENDKGIIIKFRNKGDKIPEYKLSKIFEKFYRGDDSRKSTTGGSGLGLAITKEIIELHGGNIMVKNDDEFIEFNILLPLF